MITLHFLVQNIIILILLHLKYNYQVRNITEENISEIERKTDIF